MNRFTAVLAFALAAAPAVVLAHDVALWAEVHDNRVWVEAYDTEGQPVPDAQVIVKDPDGKMLLEGKTDDKGKLDFAPPNKNEMLLELILDEHHKSKFTLKAEDLKDVVLGKPGA
jgi:uncharacterized protein YfaS (alpha-2-macroglobulin family)